MRQQQRRSLLGFGICTTSSPNHSHDAPGLTQAVRCYHFRYPILRVGTRLRNASASVGLRLLVRRREDLFPPPPHSPCPRDPHATNSTPVTQGNGPAADPRYHRGLPQSGSRGASERRSANGRHMSFMVSTRRSLSTAGRTGARSCRSENGPWVSPSPASRHRACRGGSLDRYDGLFGIRNGDGPAKGPAPRRRPEPSASRPLPRCC